MIRSQFLGAAAGGTKSFNGASVSAANAASSLRSARRRTSLATQAKVSVLSIDDSPLITFRRFVYGVRECRPCRLQITTARCAPRRNDAVEECLTMQLRESL